jgi:type IV secretion system protein VirB5
MKKLAATLCIIGISSISLPLYAQGIPVIDPASIAQAVLQLEQMRLEYQRQYEQLQQATRQGDALTGSRNMGDLFNGSNDQSMRRALPADISAMINPSSGSFDSSSEQVRSTFSLLQQQFQPVNTTDFGTNANLPWHQSYQQHTNLTHSSMAASQESYNNVAQRMQTYEGFLTELNNSPDMKTTADLQARIAVENAILMNEMIRLLSLQMQQQTAADNKDVTSVRSLHQARQPSP